MAASSSPPISATSFPPTVSPFVSPALTLLHKMVAPNASYAPQMTLSALFYSKPPYRPPSGSKLCTLPITSLTSNHLV
jgi:hypothetical protein